MNYVRFFRFYIVNAIPFFHFTFQFLISLCFTQLDFVDLSRGATSGNGSYKMEGVRGGIHPAVDINRLNNNNKKKQHYCIVTIRNCK